MGKLFAIPVSTALTIHLFESVNSKKEITSHGFEIQSTAENLLSEGNNENRRTGDCDFCLIAKGAVPRYIVFEDEISLAFLDRKPVFLGHSLLVPRVHYETISDLPDELTGALFRNAKLVARGIQSGLSSEGTFIAINNKVSQSVPHLHIHVVPRKYGDGLRGFFWPRTSYKSAEHMAETRDLIRAAIKSIQNKNS